MRISARARYALRLMIDLAEHWPDGSPVILREVAERQGISKRYLEQMAATLRNANLVTSMLGRGGGYFLPRPPQEITVSEIIEASIGRINVVCCVGCPDICPRSNDCRSREMWEQVNANINAVFERVTLAQLCEGERQGSQERLPTPCSPQSVQESA